MSSLDETQLVYLARIWHGMGKDLEEFFDLHSVDEELRVSVRSMIIPERVQIRDSGIGVGPGVDITWPDRIKETEWRTWRAHEHYLRFRLKRPSDIVDSITEQSEHILRRLPDPFRESFSGKGLVIGYVQSGKTANFTAVAARAVDAGYRMILVLSGIHNNLRAQTQRRLERELTGRLIKEEVGINRPERGRAWIHLTDRGIDGDFYRPMDASILEGDQPIIAVIKKICPVLNTLHDWLDSSDPQVLSRCPILIIDDEADQASVNTGQDRPDEETDAEEDESSPSRTNELIRLIIKKLPRVAYLAYTATPFANVLIDPQTTDREAGGDLFPADFIWQLPRPDGYTGTRELFGAIEHESRDVLRFIPDTELASIRPPSARDRRSWHPVVSNSIIEAIDEYILAGGVRIYRGHGNQHHTMLIHSTHFTECQSRIVECINTYLEGLKGEVSFGGGSMINRLRMRWEEGFHRALDDASILTFEDIEKHIPELLNQVHVLELNSASDDELDFDGPDSVKAICIGGNRLSRGLTLEGLTVSIYVRTTGMADTLLQMARWYGFRIGYEDLIRIYTTPDISSWFAELALVEDDLRNEIDRLRMTGLPPIEQGVRLRAHSALRLTSPAKSRNAVVSHVGWSGSHPQNIVLPINNSAAMFSDYSNTETFLSSISLSGTDEGLVANEIPADQVTAYLLSLTNTGEARVFDFKSITSWITKQVNRGHVQHWTVFTPSNKTRDAKTISIAGRDLALITRSKLKMQNSIGVLVDPKHEAIDLPEGPESYRRNSGYDTEAMRRARHPSHGLLIIYLLDPESESNSKGRERLVAEHRKAPPAVVSVGLSLPFVPDDEARAVIVGEAFADV